jgi:hypothetical protein
MNLARYKYARSTIEQDNYVLVGQKINTARL